MIKKSFSLILSLIFIVSNITLPANAYNNYERDTLRPLSAKHTSAGKLMEAMHRGNMPDRGLIIDILARSEITEVPQAIKEFASGAFSVMMTTAHVHEEAWTLHVKERVDAMTRAVHMISTSPVASNTTFSSSAVSCFGQASKSTSTRCCAESSTRRATSRRTFMCTNRVLSIRAYRWMPVCFPLPPKDSKCRQPPITTPSPTSHPPWRAWVCRIG